MTLHNFLATFKSADIQVTIIDGGEELITFKASGYECLEDTLENRVIREWSIINSIINPVQVKIVLVSETTE